MRVKTSCTWRMKPSPSKTTKTAGGKKRAREEAAGSAAGTSAPVSPPRPDPNREWNKSKAKTEDLLALLNSVFMREKEVDMWRAAAGDPYPMEKHRTGSQCSPGSQSADYLSRRATSSRGY
jgi:hypothetical protein